MIDRQPNPAPAPDGSNSLDTDYTCEEAYLINHKRILEMIRHLPLRVVRELLGYVQLIPLPMINRYQQQAKTWKLRGEESGGAVELLGHYVGFVGVEGGALGSEGVSAVVES